MRLFDTHAHYYDEHFDADRDAVLSSLPGKGVERVVCPGCDLASSRQSMALAEKYPFLYFAAGLHPENREGAALADLEEVKRLCAHPKCVAVGEIGLDYYWVKTPEERKTSRDFFDAQLSLSDIYHLNVGDVIDLGQSKEAPIYLEIGGYHWFTGKMGTHKKNMAVKIDEVCYQLEQRSE